MQINAYLMGFPWQRRPWLFLKYHAPSVDGDSLSPTHEYAAALALIDHYLDKRASPELPAFQQEIMFPCTPKLRPASA